MKIEQLAIRRHRPGRDLAQALVAIALFVVAGYLAYDAGRDSVVPGEPEALQRVEQRLASVTMRLGEENDLLRERTAILERASQIERRAYSELDRHLRVLQAEVADLQEEVAFYRGILSAGQLGGLSIQSFEVDSNGDGRSYEYWLVLTGDLKDAKVIDGTVDLSITGEQQGRVVELSHADISDSGGRGVSFQLTFFQKVRGRLTLPEDFVPRRVLVRVTAATGKAVERTFDWPVPVG